jgi:cobyrinic acid a,c-diamide synthase
MYTYIYIYMYICMYIYMYIYVYRLDTLSMLVETHVKLDLLLEIARTEAKIVYEKSRGVEIMTDQQIDVIQKISKMPPVRVAVAKDEAFCFYYHDNLRQLQLAGGDLVYFSPIHDKELPPGVTLVYFGGGYPGMFTFLLIYTYIYIYIYI